LICSSSCKNYTGFAKHLKYIHQIKSKDYYDKFLKEEIEVKELSSLSRDMERDSVLKKLWDNKKDAAYDKL